MSVTEIFALRAPTAEGVKVTLMVQLAPGVRLVMQLLVGSTKSSGFVPVMATAVIFKVPEEATFVNVTVVGSLVVPTVTLPKLTLVGLKPANVPVPLSATVCGLPGALSLNDSVPVRSPLIVGLKAMSTVQLAPGTRVLPQWFVFR